MDVMDLLGLLLTGLIVGAIARLLVKGKHRLGWIGTSMLGILGSFVGGTLFNSLNGNNFDIRPSGFLGALFGAVALLVVAQLVGGQSRSRSRSRR